MIIVLTMLRLRRGQNHARRGNKLDSLGMLLPKALHDDLGRFVDEQKKHSDARAAAEGAKVRRLVCWLASCMQLVHECMHCVCVQSMIGVDACGCRSQTSASHRKGCTARASLEQYVQLDSACQLCCG